MPFFPLKSIRLPVIVICLFGTSGFSASAKLSDNEKASKLMRQTIRSTRDVPAALPRPTKSRHVSLTRADEFFLVSGQDTRSGAEIFSSLWGGGDRTEPADFRTARNRRLRPMAFDIPDFFAPNPNYETFNTLFESLHGEFPADLLKAIAWTETRWIHADAKGNVVAGVNYKKNYLGNVVRDPATGGKLVDSVDWGLMQINDRKSTLEPDQWDFQQIKNDPRTNIRAAIQVLRHKLQLARQMRQRANWRALEARYNLMGYSDLQIAIKAYNGLQYSSRYVDQVMLAMERKPWERKRPLPTPAASPAAQTVQAGSNTTEAREAGATKAEDAGTESR